MKEFKLYDYHSLKQAITSIAKELNDTISVAPKLAPYIDGLAVINLDRQAILETIKLDTAKHMPGFMQYLEAGVNLTSTMPNCEASDNTLGAIQKLVDKHRGYHLNDGLRYVAYLQETGQFAITATGEQALDQAITRLNETDSTTFDLVTALHTHLVKSYGRNSVLKLLPGDVLTGLTENISERGLVARIKILSSKL